MSDSGRAALNEYIGQRVTEEKAIAREQAANDSAAQRDFTTRDDLFDGTLVIPAKEGRWFVAVQASVDGKPWQGYLPREFGKQWFVEVKPGVLLDVSEVVIEMKPQPEQPK